MADLEPPSPPGSPTGSPPTSPRSHSGYGYVDDIYMQQLMLNAHSPTPLVSNPSIEHSSSPLDPNDFKQLIVIREITNWPCTLNNDTVRCDIPSGTTLDIIDTSPTEPIFICEFKYNGILHYTRIFKIMLNGNSPSIEYLTNSVGGYNRRSIKRRRSRSIKRRRSKSRKGKKGKKGRK